MKKNLTELVMILDRSGSMSGLESDTIGGYNSMLKKQRETEGDVLVSTVLFDHSIEVLHDRVPLDEVAKITEKGYYVRGCTALLDAVGEMRCCATPIGAGWKKRIEEDYKKRGKKGSK